MRAWPQEFPKPLSGSWKESEADVAIRFQPDLGPDKMRDPAYEPHISVSCELQPCSVEMKKQVEMFRVNIGRSATFSMSVHGLGVGTYRITAPIEWTHIDGGYWKASLKMERLP
jgi:hypothetical protein